jgi:hypothetical protein
MARDLALHAGELAQEKADALRPLIALCDEHG